MSTLAHALFTSLKSFQLAANGSELYFTTLISQNCYLCSGELVYENRQASQEGAWHVEHVIGFSKWPDLDKDGNLLPAHA